MIAIPVYVREQKNYDLLKACIDSAPKKELVLLSINALNEKYVDAVNHLNCIYRDINSVAGAWNDAIECAYDTSQNLIIANQDIEFPNLSILYDAIQLHGIAATKTQDGQPDFALFGVNPSWVKSTFGTLRPFDEGYEGAYFEDNDFRYQCKLKGINIPLVDLEFKHFGSSVVKLDLEAQKENEQRFRKNHLRYINKWGGIRGGETFKTPFNK